jgi:hypothetical protein
MVGGNLMESREWLCANTIGESVPIPPILNTPRGS